MNASQFKVRKPWVLVETLNPSKAHLKVEVPYQDRTACGRIVFDRYYKDKAYDRPMCKSCLRTIGYTSR